MTKPTKRFLILLYGLALSLIGMAATAQTYRIARSSSFFRTRRGALSTAAGVCSVRR